jgi:hypothetical protein
MPHFVCRLAVLSRRYRRGHSHKSCALVSAFDGTAVGVSRPPAHQTQPTHEDTRPSTVCVLLLSFASSDYFWRVCAQERGDGLHDVLPFVCADAMSQLPISLFFALGFGGLVYAMAGFRFDSGCAPFFIFCALQMLLQYILHGLALMSACVSRNASFGFLLAQSVYPFLAMSAGK